MTNIVVISGFLGAGKTTLIKKMISCADQYGKVAVIENDFGEVSIDSTILKETGIQVEEIAAGCICCTLLGSFKESLKCLVETYKPDWIFIEPSGVAGVKEIKKALALFEADIKISAVLTVVDAACCPDFIEGVGEFYVTQIQSADCIVLSHVDECEEEEFSESVKIINDYNPDAVVVTTPLKDIASDNIWKIVGEISDSNQEIEKNTKIHSRKQSRHHMLGLNNRKSVVYKNFLKLNSEEAAVNTDGNFESYTYSYYMEQFSESDVNQLIDQVRKCQGHVYRIKGMLKETDSTWLYFDYVNGRTNIRKDTPAAFSVVCIIGTELVAEEINAVFKGFSM